MNGGRSNADKPDGRLIEVARSLDLYAAPATLTDRGNHLLYVNRAYARAVGDPNRDRLPAATRFLPAAMLGPYRSSFPRVDEEIAACFSVLLGEVEHGRLADRIRESLTTILTAHPRVARLVDAAQPWDGVIVFRDDFGRMVARREHVIPVATPDGRASGFHINLWVETDERPDGVDRGRDIMALTPRQRQVARLLVEGLSARAVADHLGISHSTVRGHLEAIHATLDVHSRAELTALLVREGIA